MKLILPVLPDLRTREGVKTATRFVVARATSITIAALINQNVDTEELSTYKTTGVFIGSHVLGEMVADATKPFVDQRIDHYAEMLSAAKASADAIDIIEAPQE